MHKKLYMACLASAASLYLPASALASTVGYQFTDVAGANKSIPADEIYLNAASTIKVFVSAGIERKVRLTLTDKEGATVNTFESELVGPGDRFSFEGRSYYGVQFSIPAPAEGSYTIKSEILSTSGEVSATSENALVQDVTAPNFGEFSWSMGYGGGNAPDGLPKFSRTYARIVRLHDVIDEVSGFKSGRFESYYASGSKSGELYSSKSLEYLPELNQVVYGSGTGSDAAALIPGVINTKLRLNYILEDKAGNISTAEMFFYANSACNLPPELVAVKDPTFSGAYLNEPVFQGYRPVTSVGPTPINVNPISAVYRTPIEAWHESPGGAISGSKTFSIQSQGNVHQDDKYVYVEVSGPVNEAGLITAPNARWTNESTWKCQNFALPKPEFSADTLPPQPISLIPHIKDYGWAPEQSWGYRGDAPRDTVIDAFKLTTAARPYDQFVTGYGGRCDIPAGETTCIATINLPFNTSGTANHYNYTYPVQRTDQPAMLSRLTAVWEWDADTPTITELVSHDEQRKSLVFKVVEQFSGRTWNRVNFHSAGITAIDGSGREVQVSPTSTYSVGDETLVTVNYASIGEGDFELVAWAKDNYLNQTEKTLLSVTNDMTAPSIQVEVAESITSLNDITIRVADNMTAIPLVTEVRLQDGPANEDVFLNLREVGTNEYKLEYPVMFPSLQVGEEYVIAVSAADSQHNSASAQATFSFAPPQVGLDAGNSEVLIPASTHAFSRPDGTHAIVSSPMVLPDGSTIEGRYPIYATLRSDSDMPLRIADAVVEPGQTVTVYESYDFSQFGGRISLPVAAADNGLTGTANLLINTVAPDAPVLVTSIRSWQPDITFSGVDPVVPGLDRVELAASTDAKSCTLTTDRPTAMAGNLVSNPLCYFEWMSLPAEFYAVRSNPLSLVGYATSQGPLNIPYHVSVFDIDGSQHLLDSGSVSLTAVDPSGILSLSPERLNTPVERVIEYVDFKLKADDLNLCSLTVDSSLAASEAAAGRPTCLLEISESPEGLELYTGVNSQPGFRGQFLLPQPGTGTVEWNASVFTPNGTKVSLGQGSLDIPVVNPAPPTVELIAGSGSADELMHTPTSGGYLGDVTIVGRPTPVLIERLQNDEVVFSEILEPAGEYDIRNRFRLSAVDRPMWSFTDYTVRATYVELPELVAEGTYHVLAVPESHLRPYTLTDATEKLSTESLSVTVGMADPYDLEAGYNASEMGEWNVRLVNMLSLNNRPAITEFVKLDAEGKAEFDVNLSDIEGGNLRLMAEAQIISPVEGFSRVVYSARPDYITVLKGEAVESEIVARQVSGPAPLRLSAVLSLVDRQDYSALGDVIWEQREGTGTWVAVENNGRSADRLYQSFDAGTYELRARVLNRHSGAEFTTGTIAIQAFDVPKVTVSGPRNAFITDTVTLSVTGELAGSELSDASIAVEWSEDGGQTWVPGSNSYSLTRDEEDQILLYARARMASAPADNENSWVEVRNRVSFKPVKPPRVSITGPRVVEVEGPSSWSGESSAPMRDMDVTIGSRFLGPDGNPVDGDKLTYQPTDADLEAGYITITYQAWIEGFEDQSFNEIERRVRIWEYEWPNWGFYIRQTAAQAPAEVQIRVRSPSGSTRYIENLQVEWQMPEGAIEVENRFAESRAISVVEPGEYPIQAILTDDRGHRTVLTDTIVLAEPDPWIANFSFKESNDHRREPLTLTFRPDVSGGHPRDRIVDYRYLQDGVVVDAGRRYGEIVLGEGSHTVGLEVETQFGHVARAEETVVVSRNQMPSCSLNTSESMTGIRFYAVCDDPDGYISEYQWKVNGENVGIRSARISVTIRPDDPKPEIVLVGIDDAGAASEPVRW